MRADYIYPEHLRPYEPLDADLLDWAASVGDFDQGALYAVADGLSRLISPGRYWMNSAEARGLIERRDEGMHGRRWHSISDAGRLSRASWNFGDGGPGVMVRRGRA